MGTEIHWEETKWAAESEKEMGRKTRYQIWQLAPLLETRGHLSWWVYMNWVWNKLRQRSFTSVHSCPPHIHDPFTTHFLNYNLSREVVPPLRITNKIFSAALWAQSICLWRVCSLRYLATCPGEKHSALSCFFQPIKNIDIVI